MLCRQIVVPEESFLVKLNCWDFIISLRYGILHNIRLLGLSTSSIFEFYCAHTIANRQVGMTHFDLKQL